MSYRTYLNFKTEDNEFSYQLFGNNDYFEEVMDYVTNGDKRKYKKLENNDFAIYNFKINDFWDFCMKVIIPVAKIESEAFNKTHNLLNKDYTYISMGRLFQRNKEESDTQYLQRQYLDIWFNLTNNYLLEFYNLIEFMEKNKLINIINFKLKPDMKIFLQAY